MADAIRQIGVSEVTFYRWRKEYGGMKADQLKRLKELEKENERLTRISHEAILYCWICDLLGGSEWRCVEVVFSVGPKWAGSGSWVRKGIGFVDFGYEGSFACRDVLAFFGCRRELWPEVGDSLRKGWRIVVVMNPPHLQERTGRRPVRMAQRPATCHERTKRYGQIRVLGISAIGRTCEHIRSHALNSDASRVLTAYMPRREMPPSPMLRAVALKSYRKRYRTAYGSVGLTAQYPKALLDADKPLG